MGSKRYTITPLCVGTLTGDMGQLVWGHEFGVKREIPVLMFYLEGGGKHIMVDTGCSEPGSAGKYHGTLIRTPEQEPARALESIGVHPSEIDIVIATHLHWDHCYNHEVFTNARFLVQRRELQYAAAPHPIFMNAYEAPTAGMTPAYGRTAFEVLDGDTDILGGLKVIQAPGHTPGMQCVAANTLSGVYYIASDSVLLYDNLEGNQFGRPIPGMFFLDLAEYYRTLRRMLSLADHILPGHDMRVLDRARYG